MQGDKRLVMFLYGSGLSSTIFLFKLIEGQHPLSLSNIASVLNVHKKLAARHVVSIHFYLTSLCLLILLLLPHCSFLFFSLQTFPEKFDENMKVMEHRYGAKDFVTSANICLLAPGTYYLTNVDSMYRRYYAKKVVDSVNSKAVAATTAVKDEALINGHS